MKENKIYTIESQKQPISLNEQQKDSIRNITLGIEEVDETVRTLALEDVINTISNGHPLNRIIEKDGKIEGYIACEDFVPNEAYIKYLGTTRQTGKNLLQEIPAFLEYAKKEGYNKLNFHGWNERLNNILTRYGFQKIRTDKMLNKGVDFYEKILKEEKTEEEINEERMKAFEQKYINYINQEYQNTLKTFKEETRENKNQEINEADRTLSDRLATSNIEFGERQKAILKLKLARYFQNNETIDINTLYDAIIETPNFINTDKGSLFRLLEVHQEKTLIKIAEKRKKKAEQKEGDGMNPYEALFETKSGDYYMARLLNMPHLEEESEYMTHCVGTSDSYINKIKRGEVEILSFRHSPKIDKRTNKLEGDTPIITIEYNLKTKIIQQMKKKNDGYLTQNDEYFDDVVDALKQLKNTKTDTGEYRNFKQISKSEMNNFEVKDYHLLTENGEVDFRDFDPDDNALVLKIGKMNITPEISKEDASKILKIVGDIKCTPNDIALSTSELTENTKVYIGEWNPEISKQIPKSIEYLYESFPDKKIFKRTIELSTKTPEEYTKDIKEQDDISPYAQDILNKIQPLKQKESIDLISFSVLQLGFPNGATLKEIYDRAKELGLELCPPQAGPELRLSYKDQPIGEWLRIAMDPISDRDGDPTIFSVECYDDGLWLDYYDGSVGSRWHGSNRFVFRSRKN